MSNDSYFVLIVFVLPVVLGIPTFFACRQLYGKIMAPGTNRVILIWITTVGLSFLYYCGLLLFWVNWFGLF
jgi:uncharacterized membrane protein YjjP (DUF1212 family)